MNLEQFRGRLRFAGAAAHLPNRWNLDTGVATRTATLHLYGAIGGFWGEIDARDVVPAIRALDVDELHVYVNSPGGDVYDGVAIRNALRQHSARVVVHVDGLAASAASFIAVAGDEVVMGQHSELMIHDAWMLTIGNADMLREDADDLDRLSDNIAAMYAEKAGGTAAEWRAVMKAEAWYSADEAVAAGLADRVDDVADRDADEAAAAAKFDLSMFNYAGRAAAPAPIPAAAAMATRPAAQAPTKEESKIMNRAQLAAALAAGQITQAEHDASVAVLDRLAPAEPAAAVAPAAGAPGEPVDVAYATGPSTSPAPAAHTQDRPRSFREVANEAVDALRHDGIRAFVSTINNALDPVVIGDDTGGGFTAPDRIGQVWQAHPEGRPHIDALGGTRPLTSTKIEGWKWTLPTPAPEPYAGELAEVPSDAWETVPVSETPSRWAKANKIDRIYTDLGSADLIASLFAILGQNYDGVSDAAVAADLVAGATAITGGATTVIEAISKAYLQLKKIGATVSKMWMAEDLFTGFAELKVADLPAWIANATGFVRLDGNVSLTNVFDVDVDFELDTSEFLALDSRAATVFESPQIKLEAQDVAHGGVDIGFFAYGGTLINDPRAVVKTTVTPEG